MSFAMIYAVFVIGLNVFMGFAGQVSFGHNAFAAIVWLRIGDPDRELLTGTRRWRLPRASA